LHVDKCLASLLEADDRIYSKAAFEYEM
jgi:hypothetical protein